MRIIIAPDSFKGCLTAAEVAHHLAAGLRAGFAAAAVAGPGAPIHARPHRRPPTDPSGSPAGVTPPALPLAVDELPLADGGEGFVAALLAAKGGRQIAVTVTGPLGTPAVATFGLLQDNTTAVIEMASAAGWHLVPPEGRDPWRATSRGVGELIAAALDHGARRLIIGLGGSGTHDAGAGMAQALGIGLYKADGTAIGPGAAGLTQLTAVDRKGLDHRLQDIELIAAHDVNNPLAGPQGAAAVYGPQKGARPEDISKLDAAVLHFARVIGQEGYAALPGAGAAGGLGFGLAVLLGARLQPGAAWLLDEIGAIQRFRRADLVITGEGRMDASTLHDKLPVVAARYAQRVGTPVLAVCGALTVPPALFASAGIQAVFALPPEPIDLAQALARAPQLLEDLGWSLGGFLGLCRG